MDLYQADKLIHNQYPTLDMNAQRKAKLQAAEDYFKSFIAAADHGLTDLACNLQDTLIPYCEEMNREFKQDRRLQHKS
tara:strand:+ start:4519 stop:4752 length:234 start_codon:yes stop_codon:yes gene_type:complete